MPVLDRATTKQYGVVRFAPLGESTPNAAVRADDPRITGSPTSPSGPTTILSGIGVVANPPTISVGNVGDVVLALSNLTLWKKMTSVLWKKIAHLPISVTNTEARFICPDGTQRGTILTP